MAEPSLADLEPIPLDQLEPATLPTLPGEFGKGVQAGIGGIQRGTLGLARAAADVAGADIISNYAKRQLDAQAKAAEEYAPAVGKIEDIKSARDVALWASGGLGQLAPYAALSAATAGAGAALGGTAGVLGGLTLASVPQEVGSIYADQPEAGRSVGKALAYGIPAGALDVLPQLRVASKFLGAKTGVKEGVVKDVLKQVAAEGSTEGAQTALERAGASKKVLDTEGVSEILNAAALGALGGGVIGGAARGAEALLGKPEAPTPGLSEVPTPPALEPLGPVSAAAALIPRTEVPPTAAPPWQYAEPGGTQEAKPRPPPPATARERPPPPTAGPPAPPSGGAAVEVPAAPVTPPAGPLEAAAAPLQTSKGAATAVEPSKRFPTEAMATRAAEFETKRTGAPQAVVNEQGGFFIRPQAALDAEQAQTTKMEEARKAGEAARTAGLKAAEEAAKVATTPAKEGEPPERIYKKDARDYISDLQGSIATMQGQIEVLRSSELAGDLEFVPRIEKQIELAEKKQAAIAKRAKLEFTPGAHNALAKPSPKTVGAQPNRSEGTGRPEEGGGVGGGDALQAAGAGKAQGEGQAQAAAPAEAAALRPAAGVGGDQQNVQGAQGQPAAQAEVAGVAEVADQIDRTTPPAAPPTQAQAIAGNYQKDHIAVGGLDIAIENREGSIRQDKEHAVPEWQREIKNADYGYIKRTAAADEKPGQKAGLDVFVKPGTPATHAGPVYVIDQIDQKTEAFDETKTMVGYASKQEALAAYRANYPKGWKTGQVTEAPLPVFEQWAKSAQSTKPFLERGAMPLEKTVTLKVREEETGRPAEVDLPAHEALAHLDQSIQRAKDLLACLSL